MNKSACILLLAVTPFASARAAQFKFPNHTFTVPDGFEVELVAGPPLVERPIVADFDEQGRFYVADSSGSNDKLEKQLQDKPHRIVRLDDADGDGRFDKSTVFADKMMFPEGAMWFDGSLYVGAPPSIWKLTDTDGDGVADHRAEWFQGRTMTGCGNDLHGPYLGPDGWIYWCKGAFAKQTYERPGKVPFVTRAAHIFRCRPDRTGIEPVMTGGMDNPVAVVFTPAGERIFSTTFLQHPEAGKRDGLIHAIYGGVYGKSHDVLDDHKRTGDLMPVLVNLGPAAPCGLVRYASRGFGGEFQDNLFACLFNLHKVTRHVLEPQGATFRTRDSDFLVSDNPDFHPTDVLEDADGSLLVIDTGGWYKLCCPTSQLAKPDVRGAIYRVRRTGAPKINDPRGLKLPWAKMKPAELANLLGDDRPAVRDRAIQQLAKNGADAVPALAQVLEQSDSRLRPSDAGSRRKETALAEPRRNAVWALTRIESAAARQAVRAALTDRDESVRHAAVHSISVWRDKSALPQLLALLKNSSASLQRVVAEAVGRMGDKSAVPALLAASNAPQSGPASDRVLEHSLIYALIQIADPDATGAGLVAASSSARRAALIALDQMDGGGLKPEQVTPLLASSDRVIHETASWIIGRHADWGGTLSRYFTLESERPDLDDLQRGEGLRQAAPFVRDPAIQALLAAKAGDARSALKVRLAALNVMAAAPLRSTPPAWADALDRCLGSADETLLRATVAAIRTMPPLQTNHPTLGATLLGLARARLERDSAFAVEAYAAVPGGWSPVTSTELDMLRAALDPTLPVSTRSTAASLVARLPLADHQLIVLAESLRTAGPLEVAKLLGAFDKSTNEAVGLALVSALKASGPRSGVRAELLRPHLAKFPESVRQEGGALLASLNADAASQAAHLDELLAQLKGGDVRRGQAIFNNPKAACSSCHAIGYLGGKLGPDLTTVGQIRTERDLLESIVYPSASFVRSYEPMIVVTKSGEELSGVLRSDSANEVVLATGADTEVRLARRDVAEMRPGTVSVMPQGLDEQLSRSELSDLLAFLKSTKWGAQ